MKPMALVPRHMMARKPPHGAPCTQCGVCCAATLCDLAKHLFGKDRPGPCPALQLDTDGRSSCGVVAEVGEPQLAEAARLLIGAGDGCDARFNGEAVDHAFHKRLAQLDKVRAKELRAARRLWEMPPPKRWPNPPRLG